MKRLIMFMLIILPLTMLAQDGGNEDQSISDIILGGITPQYFAAMLLFAIMGVAVNIISDVSRRDKPSEHSPQEFSLKYWWGDNWRRVVATVILLPVALLTSAEMIGLELTKFNAFVIGFGADHLIEIAKRKKMKWVKGASPVK